MPKVHFSGRIFVINSEFDAEKAVEYLGEFTKARAKLLRKKDLGAEEKAKGIADVVRARETTNQQLLAFYTRVYTDLTAPKKDPITTRVELIKNLRLSTLKELKGCYCEDELVERADSILCDISSFCNDIFFDRK